MGLNNALLRPELDFLNPKNNNSLKYFSTCRTNCSVLQSLKISATIKRKSQKPSDWNLWVWKSLESHFHGFNNSAIHGQSVYPQMGKTEQWWSFPVAFSQPKLLQESYDNPGGSQKQNDRKGITGFTSLSWGQWSWLKRHCAKMGPFQGKKKITAGKKKKEHNDVSQTFQEMSWRHPRLLWEIFNGLVRQKVCSLIHSIENNTPIKRHQNMIPTMKHVGQCDV